MTKDEALIFMRRKSWSEADRRFLVELWNVTRTNLPPMKFRDVQSSCRLKTVRGSMLKFLESMADGSEIPIGGDRTDLSNPLSE